jgi:hypothetical protein
VTREENIASMMSGAEYILLALCESATSKGGMSFGAVVNRFCELSGISREDCPVFAALASVGGLTVNNAIGDDYRPCDCDLMDVCPTGRCVPDSTN